jgi:hypothetical protein
VWNIFQTPTWVVPPRLAVWKALKKCDGVLGEIKMDDQENFAPETIQRFQSDPDFYREFVKTAEVEVNNNFPIVS